MDEEITTGYGIFGFILLIWGLEIVARMMGMSGNSIDCDGVGEVSNIGTVVKKVQLNIIADNNDYISTSEY